MLSKNNGFLSIMSILVTVLVLGVFAYIMLAQLTSRDSLEGEDIGTAQIHSVMDDTRKHIQDIEKSQSRLQKQLETIK